MREWRFKISIKEPMQQCRDGLISTTELAKKILTKLERLNKNDVWLADIISNLDYEISVGDMNTESFDEILEEIYNWGDQESVWIGAI